MSPEALSVLVPGIDLKDEWHVGCRQGIAACPALEGLEDSGRDARALLSALALVGRINPQPLDPDRKLPPSGQVYSSMEPRAETD